MIGKSSKLKSIAGEARKLIEAQLDAGEELSALREAATAEGFDWSQLKSLLTAQIKDERDGGDGKRVRKLVERAEFACAYADMLGFDERKDEIRSSSVTSSTAAPQMAADAFPAPTEDGLGVPDFLRRAAQ